MLIFVSGSVNAGKSTTSKLVATQLNAEWLDFDNFQKEIPAFQLSRDIPKILAAGISRINELDDLGKTVVANYVLRKKDYERLRNELKVEKQYYFTLAPRLEIARSDRGRGLNEWEYERIKYHYDTGVANPSFGEIIDTSDMTAKEAAQFIIDYVTTKEQA